MARQTQTSQLDTRSDVSDTSVAIQCLVAYSQSFTGAGSFNTRFFCVRPAGWVLEGLDVTKIFYHI